MAALIRHVAPILAAFGAPLSASTDAPADAARPAAETLPPSSPAVERWRPFVAEASRRFGVPQAWIAAVMRVESAGQAMLAGRPIVSRAGAMGLMQLMPGTWDEMRARHGLGTDPYDQRDNIMAGAAYLRSMYDRFGYPGLFAAYNAGPGRYAEHLRSGQPLAAETRSYIARLARAPATPSMAPAVLSGTRLFFALGTAAKPVPQGGEAMPEPSLFVPLGNRP